MVPEIEKALLLPQSGSPGGLIFAWRFAPILVGGHNGSIPCSWKTPQEVESFLSNSTPESPLACPIPFYKMPSKCDL